MLTYVLGVERAFKAVKASQWRLAMHLFHAGADTRLEVWNAAMACPEWRLALSVFQGLASFSLFFSFKSEQNVVKQGAKRCTLKGVERVSEASGACELRTPSPTIWR